MQSIVLSAEVIRISPTASIQSGVVNYSVKVKLLSTNTTRAGFAQIDENAFKEASEAIASGELPEQLKEAVEAGQMTQVDIMKDGEFSFSHCIGFFDIFEPDHLIIPPPVLVW